MLMDGSAINRIRIPKRRARIVGMLSVGIVGRLSRWVGRSGLGRFSLFLVG